MINFDARLFKQRMLDPSESRVLRGQTSVWTFNFVLGDLDFRRYPDETTIFSGERIDSNRLRFNLVAYKTWSDVWDPTSQET